MSTPASKREKLNNLANAQERPLLAAAAANIRPLSYTPNQQVRINFFLFYSSSFVHFDFLDDKLT
jgi:hypothetical protein